jgi:hypothetical protein
MSASQCREMTVADLHLHRRKMNAAHAHFDASYALKFVSGGIEQD